MQNQIKNFQCQEQQVLTATTSTQTVTFATADAQAASDARIVNTGTVGVQIKFGDSTVTAVNSASASGTAQHYLLPGEDIIVSKDQATSFAAIADSSTAKIFVHAGRGN